MKFVDILQYIEPTKNTYFHIYRKMLHGWHNGTKYLFPGGTIKAIKGG
nr:MAG TPA: hypothetical protein [Caudoviricetes sp.]